MAWPRVEFRVKDGSKFFTGDEDFSQSKIFAPNLLSKKNIGRQIESFLIIFIWRQNVLDIYQRKNVQKYNALWNNIWRHQWQSEVRPPT